MASSSVFFFSSPPRPHHASATTRSSDPWQAPFSTTKTTAIFSTPQQPSKQYNNWTRAYPVQTFPLSPSLSSSPLQTSRNLNLMSSPTRSSGVFPSKETESQHMVSSSGDDIDENTPVLPSNSTNTSVTGTASTTKPSFFFLDSTTTTTPQQEQEEQKARPQPQLQFQFSTRAKQTSSPCALLQSHAKSARDSRRRLFFDRVRNRRDDARTERSGDQVLRMDYVRERREWEAEKERVAGDVGWDGHGMVDHDDVDVDVDGENMDCRGLGVGGLSPTEELLLEDEEGEREDIGEWAEFCLRQLNQQQMQMQTQNRGREDVQHEEKEIFGEFSDDGYDEAFMEVLSQEHLQRERGGGENQGWAGDIGLGLGSGGRVSSRHQGDAEMDLS